MNENKSYRLLPEEVKKTDEYDSFVRRFWHLVRLYADKEDNLTALDEPSSENESDGRSVFNWVLILFPYLLLIVFIVSFFWDFDGMTLHFSSLNLSMDHLLRIISVSGLIGFGTNWLAITMLFKPLVKRPILGQGLIPAQKELISSRLSVAVSRDLINPELIRQKMEETGLISMYQSNSVKQVDELVNNEEFRAGFKELVLNAIREQLEDPKTAESISDGIASGLEDHLKERIDRLALKTYTLIKGKDTKDIIREILSDLPIVLDKEWPKIDSLLLKMPAEIAGHKDSIEEALGELVYTLVESFDVRSLIRENIMKLDEQHLEMLIKGTTNEQLHYIQYLGAILGAIGGLVIWAPLPAIVVLGVLFLVIWESDKLVSNLRM